MTADAPLFLWGWCYSTSSSLRMARGTMIVATPVGFTLSQELVAALVPTTMSREQ